MESDNEVVGNEVLPTDRNGIAYGNTQYQLQWQKSHSALHGTEQSNFGSNELHIVAKAYVNVVNVIDILFKPTPQTNIVTKDTVLTQYRINQGLKVFGIKVKAAVQTELQQFHDRRVVEPKKP